MFGGYFPTEVLMKALVTYPIGVELGETKNSLKTRFKRTGSGSKQMYGSLDWGSSLVPSPPPDSHGSAPSCLQQGAKGGF